VSSLHNRNIPCENRSFKLSGVGSVPTKRIPFRGSFLKYLFPKRISMPIGNTVSDGSRNRIAHCTVLPIRSPRKLSGYGFYAMRTAPDCHRGRGPSRKLPNRISDTVLNPFRAASFQNTLRTYRLPQRSQNVSSRCRIRFLRYPQSARLTVVREAFPKAIRTVSRRRSFPFSGESFPVASPVSF